MTDVCSGCGRCCGHMDRPPFTLLFDGMGATEPLDECRDWEDYPIYAAVPEELRQEIVADRKARGHLDGEPCSWLTPEGRCRHYALRPTVCREFEPGEEACNDHRFKLGLPLLPPQNE